MPNTAIVEYTDLYRLDANRKLDSKTRSLLGQYMTPTPIARFMSSFFDNYEGSDIRLIDPGAGVGTLTASFIEEFIRRQSNLRHIHVIAYEIDSVMLDYLNSTIQNSHVLCRNSKIDLNTDIICEDFIKYGVTLLANELFNNKEIGESFTHVIMNPPYKKISSTSDWPSTCELYQPKVEESGKIT